MKQLLTARTKAGLNQTQLAKMLGVDVATISRYEAGKRHPEIKIARALNKMFKIPMAVLRPDIFAKN